MTRTQRALTLALALAGACASSSPLASPTPTTPTSVVPVAAAEAAPAEAAPAEAGARIVPQAMLEGQRTAGAKVVPLPDGALRRLRKARRTKIHVEIKVCVDGTGTPARIDFLQPVGDVEADTALHAALSEWRYRPYMVSGEAVPVCFKVFYNYTIR